MRTIKTYSKGAPFYNAFLRTWSLIRTWPSEHFGPSFEACSGGKFVVSRAGGAYYARDRGSNRKFRPRWQNKTRSSLAAVNVALANPLAAKGRDIYEQQSCNACHGDNGIGSAAGPKLVGVGNKFDSQKLEALLKRPSAAMTQEGMTPTDLNGEDVKALIAYVESLK
jgi:mono/diheme cytochrome c family protein